MTVTTFTNINDLQGLQQLVARCKGERVRVAMDTEFMRERTYFAQLCLIQVKVGGDIYCIDVLSIDDISCLGALFQSPDITIVFHAARQDLEALKTRVVDNIARFEDTQLAAAFCGCGDNIGYANLVKDICGVSLEKSYTRTNWAARPLSQKQLQYAAEDVDYLLQVAEYLNQKLIDAGKIDWYQSECEQLTDYDSFIPDPIDAWRKLKGGAKIPARNQSIARALCQWREEAAQQKDIPREWLVASKDLVALSIAAPKDMQALSALSQLPATLIRKRGKLLLSIIQQSDQASDVVSWQRPQRLTEQQKKARREAMTRLQELADELQISSSLLANRKDIEKMITGDHDIALLRGWRRQLIGEELLGQCG